MMQTVMRKQLRMMAMEPKGLLRMLSPEICVDVPDEFRGRTLMISGPSVDEFSKDKDKSAA
eukprot:scaffold33881_cov33-Attheya_sp.AAC.1